MYGHYKERITMRSGEDSQNAQRSRHAKTKEPRGREGENVDQRASHANAEYESSDHPAYSLFVLQHLLFLAQLIIPSIRWWLGGLVLSPAMPSTIHRTHLLLILSGVKVVGVIAAI